MHNSESEGKMLPLVERLFSVQGEGYHTGKAAYFIRLGGCDVGCSWCDSRFAWDPSLHRLVETDLIVNSVVLSGTDSVVVTGGEPLIWNLDYLCSCLKNKNIKTFIETSGAYPPSGKWDWICLSPKKNMPPLSSICNMADELKVVIQDRNDFRWADEYRKLVRKDCFLFLQPEWKRFDDVIPDIVEYVKKNPVWRISLQTHKYMHIP